MDEQEDITHFQSSFNGPFPFTHRRHRSSASRRQLRGGDADQDHVRRRARSAARRTFNHENMHQWWGDNVSEGDFNLTFFKEGMADARGVPLHGAQRGRRRGRPGRRPGSRFDTSMNNGFNGNYATASSSWTSAPSNPTVGSLSRPRTRTPGRARRTSRCGAKSSARAAGKRDEADPERVRRRQHHRAAARGRVPAVASGLDPRLLQCPARPVLPEMVRHGVSDRWREHVQQAGRSPARAERDGLRLRAGRPGHADRVQRLVHGRRVSDVAGLRRAGSHEDRLRRRPGHSAGCHHAVVRRGDDGGADPRLGGRSPRRSSATRTRP